ncbi:MAG: DUF1641 domain-containing protein [Thermoflavifilum sp.]|nr:DUF1641 domain-containing protein [Thermoflavifilum sp.]MCL6514844.1 DUF1641 domain-containing protein [Alicyclobacillus sp.]
MAKAITTIEWEQPSAQEQTVRRLAKVADEAADAADALTAFIRWIQLMHEKGWLQAMIAILEQGEDIMKILVRQANEPEYATGLKNLIGLTALLGQVDVEMLRSVAVAAREAKTRVTSGQIQPVAGIFPLLAALRDPAVGTGLAWMLEVLKSLGQAVAQPDPTHAPAPSLVTSAT